MKTIDYSYQKTAAQSVLNAAYTNAYLASVLAVAPGGGKTTISHHIINLYLEEHPNARVLVLTEGQNTLRIQYLEELKNPNIKMTCSFGHLNNTQAQVRVGIPQSINNLDWDSVDLLIVDEAHNFYLQPMVQDIVECLNPTHQILMTGSPTKYNAHNSMSLDKYFMHYISAEELQAMGVYSAVDVDIVKTITKSPVSAIKSALEHARQNGDNLDKLMIACPTIKYAKEVASYLSVNGRKVSLSTSENDKDDSEIARFKANQTDVLIVVGKGVLGFNDSMITTLIDMKSSNNLDTSFQLFARVLRVHPQGVRKTYIRLADNQVSKYNQQVLTTQKMLALMEREVYTQFNGKNMVINRVA